MAFPLIHHETKDSYKNILQLMCHSFSLMTKKENAGTAIDDQPIHHSFSANSIKVYDEPE
jgi:hypothetical protein